MPAVTPREAVPPFILTIDIGTSSVRTMLFDARGHDLAGIGAREPYQISTTTDGAAEDDPDAALERVWRCVDGALNNAGALAEQIAGVAIDTLVSNFLAIDASGKPLTPLITYADTRNDADALTLRRELDEHAAHQRTGCLLRTSYWPARLAWLCRTQPDTWNAASRFITIGEYLELKLFGESRAGYSAAAWSGLLNRIELEWDTALLAHLGLAPERFSPLVDFNTPLSGLSEAFAKRWPALQNVPWFPAVGDGAAANIGSGCTGPGRVALTVGTTGALRVVQEQVQSVPRGLWCYRVDGKRALLGGATSEGGNVYAWLRQTLQLDEPQKVEKALARMQPDAHGLTVLPFLAGERSPGWAGDARASIVGLTLGSTPLDILRASLEGVAYRFALIAEHLFAGQTSTQESTVVASGGSLIQSPVWTQIVADTLGRALVVSNEHEATSRGVAVLALEALGVATLDALPAADGPVFTPNQEHHAIYQAAIVRQKEMYKLLVKQD